MPPVIKAILTTAALAGFLGWFFRMDDTTFGITAAIILVLSLLGYIAHDEGYLGLPSRKRKPQAPPTAKR